MMLILSTDRLEVIETLPYRLFKHFDAFTFTYMTCSTTVSNLVLIDIVKESKIKKYGTYTLNKNIPAYNLSLFAN